MKEHKTQLVVIGGGPGGYAAAFYAADLGLEVTLVEMEKYPGGVCLYRGCIPSKALLHVAKLLHETEAASALGLEYSPPKIDLDKMRAWKNSVVTKLTGGLGVLTKQRKITYIQGRATFQGGSTLSIEGEDGETTKLSFDNAILATGSRPARAGALWIDSPRLMDSTTALDLPDIPQSLLVIGGGYIGLELGTVYSALGSKVSVVEMTGGLLPGADRDLVQILHKRLENQFEAIHLNTKVLSLKEEKNGIRAELQSGDGEVKKQLFERVLMSVGRVPNSQNLGLENTKIETDKRGFVLVDAQRGTREPKIYAIGDIAGEPMLAHKASHEARVAVDAIAGHAAAWQPNAIPAVVFTDPEIAWSGLTEIEAAKQGKAVEVARFPWAASGRALTLDRTDGVTKILVEPGTQRVLGVGICGVGAGELIAEATLALEMGATVEDLKSTIHAHPTLSETVMESAEVFFGQATHLYKPPSRRS
jgi:dihydrolipoamide dehydrogenase